MWTFLWLSFLLIDILGSEAPNSKVLTSFCGPREQFCTQRMKQAELARIRVSRYNLNNNYDVLKKVLFEVNKHYLTKR